MPCPRRATCCDVLSMWGAHRDINNCTAGKAGLMQVAAMAPSLSGTFGPRADQPARCKSVAHTSASRCVPADPARPCNVSELPGYAAADGRFCSKPDDTEADSVQGAHGSRMCATTQTPGGTKHGGTMDGSITAVHMMRHSELLATGSDLGGTVKLWDVRMLHASVASLPERLPGNALPPQLTAAPLPYGLPAQRHQGVVSIEEDPTGAPLLFRNLTAATARPGRTCLSALSPARLRRPCCPVLSDWAVTN